MTVRVLLFDVLRRALGPEVTAEVGEAATGGDVVAALAAEHPVVAEHQSVIRLAVNLRYAPMETVLAEGDEVAFVTPVSGG